MLSDLIIKYMLEEGGVWGLLLIFSIFGNVFLYKKMTPVVPTDSKEKEKNKQIETEFSELKNLMEEQAEYIVEIKEQLHDLFDMHNVKDDEGVPVWYIRKSFIESIDRIKENTFKLIKLHEDNSFDSGAISEINKNNIDDYRVLIENYHNTLRDLALGLERLKVEIEKRETKNEKI